MTVDPQTLFLTHQTRLFRYFLRVVGEPDTARDLTHDVFVKVSNTVVPTAPDGELRAWLFHIARNLALDFHRRRVRDRFAIAADDTQQPSQDVDLAVKQALSRLDDLDRDVFLMREVAGLGYQEIATACSLTPDAVRSRIHRARLALRAQLAAPIATRRTLPMRLSGREPER
jgi:RNA polymerase sigma-70 factor (ECF subfamily)